jgi:hypothetical protein
VQRCNQPESESGSDIDIETIFRNALESIKEVIIVEKLFTTSIPAVASSFLDLSVSNRYMISRASIKAERLAPLSSSHHNRKPDCPITKLAARSLTLLSAPLVVGPARQLSQIANLADRELDPPSKIGAPHILKKTCSFILVLLHSTPERTRIPASMSSSNR